MKYSIALMTIALVLMAGCNDKTIQPSSEGADAAEQALDNCGDGEPDLLPSGTEVCIFRKEIVIETGFNCPAFVPNRFDFQTFSSCDPRPQLPQVDLDFLNYRDLQSWPDSPWGVNEIPVELPSTNQLDLLWVVDNSGSMCQEQAQLRESFDRFIQEFADGDVDFHIGITTTHMPETDYPLEPVAESGVLQSTPQPVPGFDPTCVNGMDTDGDLIAGNYAPVRENLALAVECMENPDTSYLNVTDEELRCAFQSQPPFECLIPSRGCGGQSDPCEPADIFPDPSTYRRISRVLRSSDYLNGGALDVASLRRDFACASLVGTRGYGIEAGLAAAVATVDPARATSSGINAGFIRRDSRFGVFFVTDENDCSNDGSIPLDSTCGGEDLCEILNRPGYPDSPLLDISELRNQLVANLGQTKGRPFDAREVFIASFHGPAERFTGDMLVEDCQPDQRYVMPVCASANGISYSGDRYDRFMRSFPLGNTYPYAPNATVAIEGLTCSGTLAPSLEQAGAFLSGAVNR